jgi:hypothetical protein
MEIVFADKSTKNNGRLRLKKKRKKWIAEILFPKAIFQLKQEVKNYNREHIYW